MPWYMPWSDQIAKRVCKYLLQRYLGQFLEEKLTLDQLNVDLYKGTGTITDVALDVLALNDVAEQQSIPFEFIDGFVEEMSVCIPWASLLVSSAEINIRGLTLTFKYKERDKSKASMFESMWSSMSSSMQLAEDCLRNEKESNEDDAGQSFEGIERFAHTIDSILSRIRVKFSDTVLRLEEVLPNGVNGVALEASIKHMEYWDEAGERPADDGSQQEFIVPTFSTKHFLLEGVSFYSDEFIVDEGNDEADNSVLMARLAGSQDIAITFKHDGIAGPKVELTLRFGALTVFASPRQLHKLVHLLQAMTQSSQTSNLEKKSRFEQKPMNESDFRKIEQELSDLRQTFQPQSLGLGAHGWGGDSLEDSADFQPLNNVSCYNESVISSTSSLASSTSSFGSGKSTISQPSFIDSKPTQSGAVDADPLSATFRFHVSLASLAVVLLQDDILALSMTSPASTATVASYNALRRVAKEFFNKLGHFAVAGFGNKDFHDAKKVFLDACQLNHVRLLAAPVIIEGSEMPCGKGTVMKGSVSAASLQLLECLVEKDGQNGEVVSKCIELLSFIQSKEESLPKFESLPSLKVDFKLFDAVSRRDRGRKISQPRSEFSVVLQPVEIEMDITLFDRIANLITLEPMPAKPETDSHPPAPSLRSPLDHSIKAKTQYNFKIFTSFALLKIRFPILDMRPMHDMDRTPWWRRQVRPESLLLDVTDLTLQTCLNPLDPVSKYELDFRKLLARFEYSENEPSVPFASIAADPASKSLLSGGRESGWPRLVFSFHPETRSFDLDTVEPVLMAQSMGYMSLIANLERTQQREISPFSFQRVIHDNCGEDNADGEQLVTPASKEEIAEFQERAAMLSRAKIEIFCPTASIMLSSKPFYELLYNRLTMDLLMWKPSAPVHDVQKSFSDDLQLQQPMFNLCKSAIRCDSDSDEESEDGLFQSVAEVQERQRKKKTLENNRPLEQNRISVSLTVGQGLFDLYLPVRDALGNIIPEQSGELLLAADEVSFFHVSGYNGKKDLDYMCVQGNHATLYHNSLLTEACNLNGLRSVGSPVPHYLQPTVIRMDGYSCPEPSEPVGVGSAQSLDMLTGAIKISRDENNRSLKFIRVALGLRNSSLRYRVSESRNIWYNQLIDFFDVDDYPIIGYEPSTVVTELNLHLWNCNIDYRPLYLSVRSVLNVGSFNLSSNIAAKTNSSTLRFIAEDASFFLSDKMGHRPQTCPVNLRKDYVCVMQLGLLEIFLRLCDLSISNPKVDFKASAHSLLIRTCSDSAKALFELISYFVADGDLNTFEQDNSGPAPVSVEEEEILVSTDEQPVHLLSKSQVERVHDLMEEAMEESRIDPKSGAKAYFTVDDPEELKDLVEENQDEESEQQDICQLGADVLLEDDQDDDWESEFCILENEAGIGILPKSGLPEVRQLTPEPPRFVDNHFALPTGRTDHLRSPKHCPQPVMRYTLRELSLLWQMYGGSDFDPAPPPKHVNIQQPDSASEKVGASSAIVFSKVNPCVVRIEAPATPHRDVKLSWQERGGAGRRHDILMELELKKVQFQHEVYPEDTEEVSRQVLLIKDLEVRDRLATSQINKFLYQYYSETKPKQAHANMVVIKALQIRSDPTGNAHECCLKVSLLPLRFNIDQDALIFLVQFFTDLSDDNKDGEGEHESSVSSRNQTPTHAAPPVMSVTQETPSKTDRPVSPPAPLLIQLEDSRPHQPRIRRTVRKTALPQKPPSPPLYFRCIIFSPDVPVRLDYQGKHVDLTHGPLAGILMGLGQLNNSELRLKRISHRHGLLGVEKLLQFILNEWSGDMKRNQLPGLLGGVGPIYSIVQLFQGIRDLFWMPIEQYKKDGRLVRGLQRGANSFTTSSAMAVLELTSRLIQLIQSTAETAYDMVSPGPSVRAQRRGKEKRRQYSQPADIREGLAKAILVVKDGIGETASNLVRVANEEHEQKGVTGAVGGVLRQIPPTVVKPIILATEATNNVIGGMRSQLVPDVRKEAVDKWRGDVS